ncbi:unnamed protein product [Spirodela intermedia]|uniref:Auxin-responsive protein n=1 Tax=Spirodela intermedia TaxID=51605 RepID=A0A7I8KJT4_SPIIN|nr:unnamed protein product [Spirodela intermedia]
MARGLEHDYIGLTEVPAVEFSQKLSSPAAEEDDLLADLKETELTLGLPGSDSPCRRRIKGFASSGGKRGFSGDLDGEDKWTFSALNLPEAELRKNASPTGKGGGAPAAKAQVVGWPPIQSYRKTTMAANPPKTLNDELEARPGTGCQYVKVSMDGAPYLRKVALQVYGNYRELSSALEAMFSCSTIAQCGKYEMDGSNENRPMDLVHGPQYVLSYEDKDGDWMLVGDVPWDMFVDLCKRLRIMKGSEACRNKP